MKNNRRYPHKRIANLLVRYQRQQERGRAAYSKAGETLDKIISLKAPLGEPIAMPDGSHLMVRDQFAERNVAFTSAVAPRYKIEPYRPGKGSLPTRPRPAGGQASAAPPRTKSSLEHGNVAAVTTGVDKPTDFTLLADEFPLDDVPVLVITADGESGMAAYCSEAGNWYIVRPGHPSNRRLWADAYGQTSVIVSWAAA